VEEFESIKEFILTKGDRLTYRTFDGNNPHYKFEYFDVFLNADIGQRNSNNNPSISDFNELVIYDRDSEIMYYHIVIVREGDIAAKKSRVNERMKEGEVYLIDIDEEGIRIMRRNVPEYLKKMKEKINH